MKHICTETIITLQNQSTIDWHIHAPSITHDELLGLIQSNHMQNFLLWHEEDRARRNDMGFEFVFHAKRAIDKFNQERNNFMERIDEFISKLLPAPSPHCPIHTETPGMIIDRLSILNLKKYHMAEETSRHDAPITHKEKCLLRLSSITGQLLDLQNNLQVLLNQCFTSERTFRVYYQHKMYNDSSLNPELRNETRTSTSCIS